MKTKGKSWNSVLGVSALCALSLTSCIKDELPNILVDIEKISTTGDGVVRTTTQENSVTVYVNSQTVDLANLKLNFEISKGATITPDPATITDYTQNRQFTITSENKEWAKTWEVHVQQAGIPTKLSFDNWYRPQGALYQVPFEPVTIDGAEKKLELWATTSNSLSILLQYVYGAKMEADPTQAYTFFGAQPTTETVDGKGKALKLMTHDITMYDANKPIVSGCMFVGEFDGAADNPLKGTHFGMPFNQKPKSFKGYYNYQPQICQHNQQLDEGLIEAVLYRSESIAAPWLDGNTIKDTNNSEIIARAELHPNATTNGYQAFDIPFTYTQEVNTEDLMNWKYSLALYFASSRAGDEYKGAGWFNIGQIYPQMPEQKGTVMLIDNVEIVCE